MKINALTAVLVGLICLGPVAAEHSSHQTNSAEQSRRQYLETVWTTENGLPQNSVNAIVQTRDGYLWLATFGGLVRFDGVRFTVFDVGNTPGLKNNRILALYEDQAGSLWIGTEDGGLTRYAQGTFITLTTKDGLPSNLVRCVRGDREGALWVGTNKGLARLKDGRFTVYTTHDGLPHDDVWALAQDREGSLWIGTVGGLAQLKQGKLTALTAASGVGGRLVGTICEDSEASLWIATLTGLFRFKDGRFLAYPIGENPDRYSMAAMCEDRGENLWIGTERNLYQFKDGKLISYKRDDGPSHHPVRALLEDREGNLWIGMAGHGLRRWTQAKITTYGMEDGLPGESPLPIIEDGQGGLLIGMACGGLARLTGGVVTVDARLSSGCIWSLLRDHEGSLWVGTWGGGLYYFKDGQRTIYTKNQGLPGNVIFSLYEDRNHNIWIGTDFGLVRFRAGSLTVYDTAAGLAHNQVRFITEDHAGVLWIGTLGGLSRFQDGTFTNYTTESGLSHDYVRTIYEDQDHRLWIGTYGGGLNRFKDGKFASFTSNDGLDNIVSQILEDDRGDFWMSSNRGIYRVSRRELNDYADGKIRSLTPIVYGIADGMKSTECNGGGQPAGLKTPDGRLWFPMVKGMVVIDPTKDNDVPPPVVIEEVTVNKTRVSQANTTLPPGPGNLEIRYTGLSFVAPEKVRFKYRLEGYDQDWVEAGARRVAYYTNLPPGQYRFRVIACNNDGVWNEAGAAFEFSLQPHFYQTWWFYAVIGLMLVGAGWGMNRLRVKRLERRTRELETIVAERTTEVREQKNQLAEANLRLGEANDQLGRANENLLAVLNEFQAGVATTDAEGRVTFLSHVAESLFDRSQDQALGQSWTELFPLRDSDKARLKALCETAPARRTKLPVRIQLDGGRSYWMEVEVKDDPRSSQSKIFFFYDVSEVYGLRSLLDERARFHDLVGASSAMQLVYKQIQDVAKLDMTVLIEGETGTGKELVARAIHSASHRRERPFIAVNAAGLTESLLASQLFGHRRGAFTGATADQVGVFEAAHGGTLFLDEVGDIPMSVQTSLLRVLQEKEITRLGESAPRKVDVRILAATNRDLNRAVADGTFRQDLFYRLRVGRIQLPPLRQRLEDLPLLVSWFLGQLRAGTQTTVQDISREVMEVLMEYSWPGNVRELKNAIEYAAAHSSGSVIQMKDLPQEIIGLAGPIPSAVDEKEDEKQRILEALTRAEGNRARAARQLGIGRTTLYRRMKALGIDIE